MAQPVMFNDIDDDKDYMHPWVIMRQISDLSSFTIWTHFEDSVNECFLWNCSEVNATEQLWWQIDIGSGNGLVLSGTNNWLAEYYIS